MENVSKIILIAWKGLCIHKIPKFQRVTREKPGSLKGFLSENEEDNPMWYVFNNSHPVL